MYKPQNAASREVGCKAANGSGEGRRDIRRVSCSQPLYQSTQVDDSLEIQRRDCRDGSNRQMSGKSEILGLRSTQGRTAKTTWQPGSMHPAHALRSFVTSDKDN